MAIEVKLPDLGDGISSGDVLEILVREGDAIRKDQGVIELETDKATVEVPSPLAGTVIKVHVARGQSVPVGATLVTLDAVPAGGEARPAAAPAAAVQIEPRAAGSVDVQVPPRGVPPSPPTGPAPRPAVAPASSAGDAPTPAREAAAPAPPARAPAAGGPARTTPPGSRPPAAAPPTVPSPSASGAVPAPAAAAGPAPPVAPAGPAVRRFAREVGIDLSTLEGSGPHGRITRDDVLRVVRQASQEVHEARSAVTARGAAAAALTPELEPTAQDLDPWGPVRYEPLTRIRKTIAAKMFESWSTVPRVTNFDDADVTELERIRQASKADYAALGIKLTSLPFVVKAVAMALRKHPVLNASLDTQLERIVFKQYIHLGIAVDTERGLIVPSLRQADRLSVSEVARALAQMAASARDNSFAIDDLRGSSFTISNLGAVGGTYSTPIINTPEVAILLVGRARKMPVVVDDQVVVRLMLPLSLSYDHRLVDGAAAARFLNDVIGALAAPARLLMAP